MKNIRRRPLELYVHIPFCVRKCQYCDFLSGPSDEETKERYIEALLQEIHAVEHTEDYEIVSVFIGGGTPSALKAEAIASVMRTLQEKFFFCEDAEVTIEANPGTVDSEKLMTYRNAGINRLSLGLQSTDAEELKMLGRIHSYEEFLQSYQWAREAGFSNINIDLMFAIPGQTGEAWRQHLRQVAELNPEHISAYSLIIEEGTPFAQRELDLPDEDTEYQMYEDTAEILGTYGYQQYEISNYAKPGYMRTPQRFLKDMDIDSMRFQTMRSRDICAGIMQDTGSAGNIWDSVWVLHLCTGNCDFLIQGGCRNT